jgi:hypothetical protein
VIFPYLNWEIRLWSDVGAYFFAVLQHASPALAPFCEKPMMSENKPQGMNGRGSHEILDAIGFDARAQRGT